MLGEVTLDAGRTNFDTTLVIEFVFHHRVSAIIVIKIMLNFIHADDHSGVLIGSDGTRVLAKGVSTRTDR